MTLRKVKDIGNPIVYIFVTLLISCICYKFNDDYRRLAIFIVVFFFIMLFYYCGIHFSILMIIFFIIGVCINSVYYYIPNEINGTVRIKQINSYNIIASLNGKKVILNLEDENLKIAKRYIVKGKIKNNVDKQSGIVGEIEVEEYIPIEDDLLSKIFEVKIKVYELLKENLGERKSSLISSISFGYKEYLDEEDENDMKNFGIIHSISVSGLHVAIVYAFLKKIVGSRIGLLGTILYVILTGNEYSSIRAFIMLAAIEGAEVFKRNNNSLSSISLSGIIVLIMTPYAAFQISFHLSYLATIGIILFNKKLNEKLYKIPNNVRESLCITLSAQIFTTPYLMIIFKDFSLNFILGNLFLAPFINVIVISGNLLILTYWCTPIFDFICYIMLKLVNIFDYAVNQFENFTLPMFYGNEYIAFFYSILLFSLYFFHKGYKKFMYLPIVSILIILVQMYSPIPCIEYYREGAIVISNKGKNILITNKNPVDIQRLSKISYATHLYRDIKQISIKNVCQIEANGPNYILSVNNEKYFLKLSGNKYEDEDYDIINFKEGKITKLIIFDNKIYKVF
ncbi:MAG: ComEC/Rec2 family competence protein [Clostridium butyricum]|nr:ComEC/Rec2 family competence protein [Clostridium butyricum]